MEERSGEWVLKHGTRQTDPSLILSGTGIDPRFSGSGNMYGQAAYFAESAAYSDSHKYAFVLPTGERKMFLAKVAAGRIEEKASHTQDCCGIRHPSTDHDSVRGTVAANYKAIMTYEAASSYPFWLVTYKH